MIRKILVVIIAIVALQISAFAGDVYKLDVAHTNIGFSVKHMVISTVVGKFTDFYGTIIYDENNPLNTQAEVTIQTASINTDNPKRDAHLRSPDFFNAKKFPTITFKTKKIVKQGDQLLAIGDLTMHGVTKEIRLPFTITGKITDPWGNTRIGLDASTTINRQDFGIKWNMALDSGGFVVSDEVKIIIHVEAIKQ